MGILAREGWRWRERHDLDLDWFGVAWVVREMDAMMEDGDRRRGLELWGGLERELLCRGAEDAGEVMGRVGELQQVQSVGMVMGLGTLSRWG